jgi:hypothetical protein
MAVYDGSQNGGFPSKPGSGQLLPENAVDSGWNRLETLITPEKLVRRHLFGIPLVSRFKNPITGKFDVLQPDDIKDEIERAVSNLELEMQLDIFPVQHQEKYPFDRHAYEAFGYFQTYHRPVVSIEELAIVPANNIQVYEVPLDWVETAYLSKGQINIVPLNVAVQNGGFIPSQSAGGAVFLSILAQNSFIPAYWRITYTTGWPNGILPRVVNEVIGYQAAIQILSMLMTTYVPTASHSLGIDSLSQSISTPIYQLFQMRIEQLEKDKKQIIGKLKNIYGLKIFSGQV